MLVQGIDGAYDRMHVEANVLPYIPGRIAVTSAHRPQVTPRTQDPARGAQYHHVDGIISLTCAQRCGPVRQYAIVEGIELVGTVQAITSSLPDC